VSHQGDVEEIYLARVRAEVHRRFAAGCESERQLDGERPGRGDGERSTRDMLAVALVRIAGIKAWTKW